LNKVIDIDQLDGDKVLLLDLEHYSRSSRQFHRFFSIFPQNPGLEYLSEILFHFSRLPYENISKIIKRHRYFERFDKIRLPDEVMDDHAQHGLGGTCFSLTYFLQTILHHRGFPSYPVMVDMRWGENVHCALIVLFDESKYLVDPGYLLNRPMELTSTKPRIFHNDNSGVEMVFQSEDQFYHIYTFNRQQTKWRYRFKDRPVSQDEFLHYWLDSFGWNSMHGLCLTKVEKGRMVYIHKNYMRQTTSDGKQNFNIRQNYHETIRDIFRIDPALVDEAKSALEANLTRERELGLRVPKEKRRNW
jgi:arylamine N-acetyltransferase